MSGGRSGSSIRKCYSSTTTTPGEKKEKKEKQTHLTKISVVFMVRVQLGHTDKICHALIGRRGSPSLQICILLRSEDSASTCDIIVCVSSYPNPDDIGTRGFDEQIGFMSDPPFIDKDDRCSHRHGEPASDVNAVNCYLLTALFF